MTKIDQNIKAVVLVISRFCATNHNVNSTNFGQMFIKHFLHEIMECVATSHVLNLTKISQNMWAVFLRTFEIILPFTLLDFHQVWSYFQIGNR